jgi:hypothetical protein
MSKASLSYGNFLRSSGDAEENLIAVTSACPLTKIITHQCKGHVIDGECYPYPQNLNHPPDKIFGGIHAGSPDFTYASVRYYF